MACSPMLHVRNIRGTQDPNRELRRGGDQVLRDTTEHHRRATNRSAADRCQHIGCGKLSGRVQGLSIPARFSSLSLRSFLKRPTKASSGSGSSAGPGSNRQRPPVHSNRRPTNWRPFSRRLSAPPAAGDALGLIRRIRQSSNLTTFRKSNNLRIFQWCEVGRGRTTPPPPSSSKLRQTIGEVLTAVCE